MGTLSHLEPKEVFQYFEEMAAIPHGSGNMKQICEYCVDFAKAQGLSWEKDDVGNVVIRKAASAGYEQYPAVIIQGHLDMVCEKTPESNHDFMKDGLDLKIDGDFIYAQNTSLGGDDGIAVAYALALLADKDAKHPELEVLLTIDEETGMGGATALDTSGLKGKFLINIDSEEEGIFFTSCAGGKRGRCTLPMKRVEDTKMIYNVAVVGLQGGHSGIEINKCRYNANILIGRLLHAVSNEAEFRIVELEGGTKDNVITKESHAVLAVAESDMSAFEAAVKKQREIFISELKGSEAGINVQMEIKGIQTVKMLEPSSNEIVTFMLMNVPSGVQTMSAEIPGLVETSLNLGVLKLEEHELELNFGIRSCKGTAKDALSEKLDYLTNFLGGDYEVYNDYPAWEFNPNSKLRDAAATVYEKQTGKKPVVTAIHAGLECGLLSDKMPGVDMLSFGPDMYHVHSTEEKLRISSVKSVGEFLRLLLENCSLFA